MCGQDADFENRLIHVDGKMGKRTAFMDDTVINVLQPIVPVRPADLVFTTAKGLQIRPNALPHTFTKAVNILGLNDGITDPRFKVVIHTLRRTFCSWLASQNVPLYTIGKLVGHTSLRSTQRYAKLSPDAAIATCSLLHASDERRDAHGCLDDVLGGAPVLELLAGADALDAGLREPEPHHDPALIGRMEE